MIVNVNILMNKIVVFLDNVTIGYQNPIKIYLSNHDILNACKAKIDLLDEEMTNDLENKITYVNSL